MFEVSTGFRVTKQVFASMREAEAALANPESLQKISNMLHSSKALAAMMTIVTYKKAKERE